MASAISVSIVPLAFNSSLSSSSPFLSLLCSSFTTEATWVSTSSSYRYINSYAQSRTAVKFKDSSSYVYPLLSNRRNPNLICKAAEYQFPDPIPEFADAETEKFRTHLLKKLSKKDIFGDSIDEVVGICTQIFSTFLHAEYGGPGTLLVVPFIDMADTLNEQGLPGGPQAARAAVKWAQDRVDKDWKEWTSKGSN